MVSMVMVKNTAAVIEPDAQVHASRSVMFAADGMLYHSAICEAARELGIEVARHKRGTEFGVAARALGVDVDRFNAFMGEMGRSLRPPWQKDHRAACAAAIHVLCRSVRLNLAL